MQVKLQFHDLLYSYMGILVDMGYSAKDFAQGGWTDRQVVVNVLDWDINACLMTVTTQGVENWHRHMTRVDGY